MKRDFDTAIDSEASNQPKIKEELEQDAWNPFEFGSPGEEQGALNCLERSIFGNTEESAVSLADRMDRLAEQFKDYAPESTKA
jgi:hypothetical protein